MATQLSAVTMIGTTGQGAVDGMRFVQFYFGLPLAMVILGVTIVPFLHGAKVFTAYEYLEPRVEGETPPPAAFVVLLSPCLSSTPPLASTAAGGCATLPFRRPPSGAGPGPLYPLG